MKKFTLLVFAFLCLSMREGMAQLTDLVNFNTLNYPQGWSPQGNVIRSGKVLYGMTPDGGLGFGNIFSVDTNGNSFKNLWNFDGGGDSNGSEPFGSLTLSGGVLYGMTLQGGINMEGNIFRIDTTGYGYKDLWNFDGGGDTNGSVPDNDDLTLVGGKLYGMTAGGGKNYTGVIFRIDTTGKGYKDLWDFNKPPFDTDGDGPDGDLTISGSMMYGMTGGGGINHDGNIFRIDTNGNGYKNLWSFDGGGDTNGSMPMGSLTLLGGVLYGMTYQGGINTSGNVFRITTDGNGYKNLWSFDKGGDTNGSNPYSGSLVFSMGKLYGMTALGGIDTVGNIFSIDTSGKEYKNLWNFNHTDGWAPLGSLLLSGNSFYGMTEFGGLHDAGVVFRFKDTSVTTSVNQLSVVSNQLSVYPNPSTGIFTIQSSVVSGQWSVDVFNVLGEKIYSSLITHHSSLIVDLHSKSNGVYFYRILTSDGEETGRGKIVVEK